MKTLLLMLMILTSTHAFSYTDYTCRVRQYQVDMTLTEDTSTSMRFMDRHETLALAYAGWVEKSGSDSIYHFYPGQFGTIDITFKTQDTIDLPEKLTGTIYVKGNFFVLWDKLECTKY